MTAPRDLYDPERRRWYRGSAAAVRHYFDHTRSQWVTIDADRFRDARCLCEKCEVAGG